MTTKRGLSSSTIAATPRAIAAARWSRRPSGAGRCVGFSPLSARYASAIRAVRAIVFTVITGYLPTAVSPESIVASAPSRMAFATSLTSARVGEGAEIMLSSICVATMTGRPRKWACLTIFFCSTGTSATSISTPRSPRATITPSAQRRIASRASMAWGFSIFAITGSRVRLFIVRLSRPSVSRRSSSSSTSEACRTKESARKSRSCSTAHAAHSRSQAVSAAPRRGCRAG